MQSGLHQVYSQPSRHLVEHGMEVCAGVMGSRSKLNLSSKDYFGQGHGNDEVSVFL